MDPLNTYRPTEPPPPSKDASGRFVVEVKLKRRPTAELLDRARRLWRGRRLPARDRIVVVEQLARLTRAGIPIVQALDEIRATVSEGRLVGALDRVKESVEAGESLGDAVGLAGALFGPGERGVVAAGEKTGRVSDVLERLANGWRRDIEFRRRVISGSLYPLLLVVAGAFIMPLSSLFFQGTGAYLWEVAAGLSWIVGLAVTVAAARGAIPLFGWGDSVRRMAWWFPGIRAIYRRKVWSDLFNGLALSFSSGLGIHDALETAATSVSDPGASRACRTASERVEGGDELTTALSSTGILPPAALVALAGAEKSGTLEESLTRLSQDQDRELDQLLKILLTVINLFVLLMVVGWIALQVLGSATSVLPGGGGAFDEMEQELMKEAPFKILL
ncbi:MAG: type II secretion system F family protein [Deltaproteobacteria bacterium]|nr:type II secretion system F family protein [Deltaproteobacteria bacterium]